MRGRRDPQMTMLAFVDLEERVPRDHPLRTIKRLADRALAELSPVFDGMYAAGGRPSIPPERLLKASLLIALYSVRSERAFCEELEYNLLFRWFLDMDLMEPSFDPTVFTKNRERLLQHEVGAAVLRRGGAPGRTRWGCCRDEHFTVDGTLIEAAASLKSFRPKDGATRAAATATIRATRRSTSTARGARTRRTRARPIPRRGCARRARARKRKLWLHGPRADGEPARAAGRLPGDPGDRHGRAGHACPTLLDAGHASAASIPRTLGGDKGYDTRDCVADLRERRVTPHVAQNTSGRRSAIDGRTTRHPGYAVSQRIRKRVEEIFGWMKTVGGFRRTRYRGLERTGLAGYLVATAYNLVRMVRLVAARSGA